MNDAGYRVGYIIAEDNLRIGRSVVADAANPSPGRVMPDWQSQTPVQVSAIQTAITCSDATEDHQRVESSVNDGRGLRPPT